MQISVLRGDASARSPHHEALLDQVGLDNVLDCAALLADRRREALNPDGATVEFFEGN